LAADLRVCSGWPLAPTDPIGICVFDCFFFFADVNTRLVDGNIVIGPHTHGTVNLSLALGL
jgi:hypothetical protein